MKQLLINSTVLVHWDKEKEMRLFVDHRPAGVAGGVALNHTSKGEITH